MRQWWTRRRLIGLAAFVVVALGVVAADRVARARLREAVARYGGEAEAGWILPTWGGVRVRDLRVSFPEAPGLSAHFARVTVALTGEGAVLVEGGEVRFEGGTEALRSAVERLRPRGSMGEGGGGGGRPIELRGLSATLVGDGERLAAGGIAVRRDAAGWEVSVAGAEGELAGRSGKVAGAQLVLVRSDTGLRLRRLSTEGVEASIRTAAPAGGSRPNTGDGLSARGRLDAVRVALAGIDARLEALLSDDARVELRGARVSVERGGETLGLGPATWVLRREEGRWVGEYLAGSAAGGDVGAPDGLLVRSRLPRPDEALEVEVRGGPILLSSLGLREGDHHLLDVDHASLTADARLSLPAAEEVVRFRGEAQVAGVSLSVQALSRQPVRGLRLSFRGEIEAALDGSRASVKDGELEVGQVRALASGTVKLGPRPLGVTSGPDFRLQVDAKYQVPLVPCQSILDAAPRGLLPRVEKVRMAGSFALEGHARFDTADVEKTFDVRWDAASTCRVVDVPPEIDVSRFTKAWKRTVPSPEGKLVELETGPGTGSWAPYATISPFMSLGVLGFEDARFHQHEGFDEEAIRNSLRDNLRTGKFTRGASTVTMQLAKNLYLEREKTLSRKLEEAVLTMYLEQALTKEQILELYLNVVEFGPMVYGVDAGAAHYFHATPSQLTISQAFYLASVLPNPKKEHFAQGGQLAPGWLGLLRTVMRHANKRGRLDDEALAKGLAEIPVRGSSKPLVDPEAEAPPADAGDEAGTLEVTDAP